MIPETIIERAYEGEVDANGKKVKQKDVNRSPNVTVRLEEYINEHNASLSESSSEKYIWFSDELSNRQRQKRAKNIIRNKLGKHLKPDWLNGSLTFNMCQLDHSKEIEECIEEIASVPVMAVYAQTERNWAIRRLMEDLFSIRRRSYLKAMKGINEKNSSNQLVQSDEIEKTPDVQPHRARTMTETEAMIASAKAFGALEKVKGTETLGIDKHSSVKTGEKESLSDIEEQILRLKNKKRLLQGKSVGNNRSDIARIQVHKDYVDGENDDSSRFETAGKKHKSSKDRSKNRKNKRRRTGQ